MNYGVSALFHMAIKLHSLHNFFAQGMNAIPERVTSPWRTSSGLEMIWRYYEVRGRVAGVARADMGKQMMAEYGVDPTYLPFSQQLSRRRIPGSRVEYKQETLQMYRKIAVGPKGEEFVGLTDEWGLDVKKDRRDEFRMIVVKIDKGDGYLEFGERRVIESEM